jgi:hypothetical protein
MPQVPVGPQPMQIWAGTGPVLFANQDLVNPVTVATSQAVFIDSPAADVIPPLGSIAYAGGQTYYGIATAGTAALLAIAGGTSWAPSPADVALQISGLGLALETTLQAASGQLGIGVAPFVENLATYSQILQGPTTGKLVVTLKDDSRLWLGTLSYDITSTGGTGSNHGYARIFTQSGLDLSIVEAGVADNPAQANGNQAPIYFGIELEAGDSISLDVNGGVTFNGCVQRASCTVLLSTP